MSGRRITPSVPRTSSKNDEAGVGVGELGPRSLSLCLPLSRVECGLLGDRSLSREILTFIEVIFG